MESTMIAVCYKCGSPKSDPVQPCAVCKTIPNTDAEIALAFMLTDRFLDKEKLFEAAQMIRGGHRIELPPSVRAAVLAALQGERARRQAQQKGIGAKRWGIITTIASILFMIFHPWPHFQWASLIDEVRSYENFAARFSSSDYATTAKERIRVLREDEIWSEAGGSGQIVALRAYMRDYPDGKYLDEAMDQVVVIADSRWGQISNSRSEAEIRRYLKSYPETSKIAEAEARIQLLYNDFDWVKEQDNLEHYRRFATRHPAHEKISAIEKRIIDLEVKEIAAGEYGEMPKAQAISYGGEFTDVTVENKTGYELTVRYSGTDSKKLVIPIGATRGIVLSPGAYQVTASVNAANVTNYYGTDSMQGGRYSSSFFIESGFGGTSLSIPDFTPSRKLR